MDSEIARADAGCAPLFIHIGAKKVGSTTIQAFLRDHEAALERCGILYPKIGRARLGHHHRLALGLRDGDAKRDSALWARLRELRGSAAPGQRIVVSSEVFQTLSLGAVRQLQELAGGGAVRILYYVRDLAGTVVATYGQRTKAGTNLHDFDEFFRRFAERLADQRREVVRSWMEVFGPKNVRVRILDPQSLIGGDLVEDLLHALGCSAAMLGADTTGRKNVSAGWKMTETVREAWRVIVPRLGDTTRKRIASRFVQAVEAASAESGAAGERGEYLTIEQRRICDQLTAQMVSEINALLPDAELRIPPAGAARERPFLPTIEHIPNTEVVRLMGHVAASLLLRRHGGRKSAAEEPEEEEEDIDG